MVVTIRTARRNLEHGCLGGTVQVARPPIAHVKGMESRNHSFALSLQEEESQIGAVKPESVYENWSAKGGLEVFTASYNRRNG